MHPLNIMGKRTLNLTFKDLQERMHFFGLKKILGGFIAIVYIVLNKNLILRSILKIYSNLTVFHSSEN